MFLRQCRIIPARMSCAALTNSDVNAIVTAALSSAVLVHPLDSCPILLGNWYSPKSPHTGLSVRPVKHTPFYPGGLYKLPRLSRSLPLCQHSTAQFLYGSLYCTTTLCCCSKAVFNCPGSGPAANPDRSLAHGAKC